MSQRWINAASTVWHAERSCAERPTAGFPEGRRATPVSEDPEPSYFDGRPCGRCVPAERRDETYEPEEET